MDFNTFAAQDDGIRQMINDRREIMHAQVACNDAEALLNDAIARRRGDLGPVIAQLARDNIDLFTYIKFLENMNGKLWCNKCRAQKTLSDTDPAHDIAVATADVDLLLARSDDLL